MNNYDIYITIIFIVKIIFIILTGFYFYTKFRKPTDTKLLERIKFWKDRFEFMFISLMSSLLIYLFNPRTNHLASIDKETKFMLYLFGFVLLLTESWNIFIHDSPIVIYLKQRFLNIKS